MRSRIWFVNTKYWAMARFVFITCLNQRQNSLSFQVHSGMFQAARRLLSNKQNDLHSLISKYPDYVIRFVGHSLGAGTAALMTILLKKGMMRRFYHHHHIVHSVISRTSWIESTLLCLWTSDDSLASNVWRMQTLRHFAHSSWRYCPTSLLRIHGGLETGTSFF